MYRTVTLFIIVLQALPALGDTLHELIRNRAAATEQNFEDDPASALPKIPWVTQTETRRSLSGDLGVTRFTSSDVTSKEFGPIPACASTGPLALDEPRCNLELGARYLHKLLELFDGQLPLAILSYNAGPDVVSHWLLDKKPLALDLFLAKVPFAETRNYVHHVLTNFLVYSWLLQQKPTLLGLEWKPNVAKLEPSELY